MADSFTTNLGLTKPEIGASTDTWGDKLNTDLDELDALFPDAIQSFVALTFAADRIAYATSATAMAVTPLTSFGRSLIDDADAAAARTTLGLGTMATVNSPVPVANGGTGSTTAAAARTALGALADTNPTITGRLTLDRAGNQLEATSGFFDFDHADDLTGSTATYRFARATTAATAHIDLQVPATGTVGVRLSSNGDITAAGGTLATATVAATTSVTSPFFSASGTGTQYRVSSGSAFDFDFTNTIVGTATYRIGRSTNATATELVIYQPNTPTAAVTMTSGGNITAIGDIGCDDLTADVVSAATLTVSGSATVTGALSSTTAPIVCDVSAGGIFECRASGAATAGLFGSATTTALYAATLAINIRPNGRTSTTNQATFATNGNFTIAGTGTGVNWAATSDARLKTEIVPFAVDETLADRIAEEFVEFSWIKGGTRDQGLVAQAAQRWAARYVHEDEDGWLAIDKASMSMEAVAGLARRLQRLEARIP